MQEVNIQNENIAKLAAELKSKMKSNCVYMCIGTEKVFSDSLGPRVGSLLNQRLNAFIYGMSEQNITAENLLYCYNFIKALHPDSTIVVVDAAVGSKDQIGNVQLCDGGILPGAATNKNLPEVGDIGIIGIVAERGMTDFYTLNSEKDQLVAEVAKFIANVIVVANR